MGNNFFRVSKIGVALVALVIFFAIQYVIARLAISHALDECVVQTIYD